MTHHIGFIGPTSTLGPAVAALEREVAIDIDETQPGQAADQPDTMQASSSHDERQHLAEDMAQSMQSQGQPNNGVLSTVGSPALDVAKPARAVGGIEPGLVRRLPGDGWQTKKEDRRRKRRC